MLNNQYNNFRNNNLLLLNNNLLIIQNKFMTNFVLKQYK